MDSTPFLLKPVYYGSELANFGFIAVVVVHAASGALAGFAGVIALIARRGAALHRRAGAWFAHSMLVAAMTGVGLDIVRLSVQVEANHSKYPGLSMPSSYPARFAFLFAALCIAYMIQRGRSPSAFSRRLPSDAQFIRGIIKRRFVGLSLIAIGAATTLLIVFRYNPWTGALWMIWGFMLFVVLGVLEESKPRRTPRFRVHAVYMVLLAAFSWWAIVQGFGPAIAIWLKGADASTTPYTGDQPGAYSPQFWLFLFAWLPSFALAAWILRASLAKDRGP